MVVVGGCGECGVMDEGVGVDVRVDGVVWE